MYFVYIVLCRDKTFYTGYTNDIAKRLAAHNGTAASAAQKSTGARYTRSRRPVELVYTETCHTRSEAQQREYAIKQLSRAQKLHLINSLATKRPKTDSQNN